MPAATLFATRASRIQTFHRRKKLHAGLQTDQVGQLTLLQGKNKK